MIYLKKISLDSLTSIANFSSFSNTTTVERSPTIACLALSFAKLLKLPNTKEIFLGALFSDLGLLEIPAKNFKNTSDENYLYHPYKSLNLILERKIQLSEEVKNYIIYSHENYNQNGFPKKIFSFRIDLSMELIRFCHDLDNKINIKAFKNRPIFRESLINEISSIDNTYSAEFKNKMLEICDYIDFILAA